MANPFTKLIEKIKYSVQEMDNMSFDTDFNQNTVEVVSYNAVTDTLERVSDIQGNGSVSFSYDGSGNLQYITKTVGAVNYQKTFTWSSGQLQTISTWVQV